MEKPKTIKAYLKIIKMIEETSLSGLKGCEKLSENDREQLGFLSAEITNAINEIEIFNS